MPWSQYGDKVLLVSTDDGETYDFPSGVWPMGALEVYSAQVRGNLLTPGTEWDANADYTWEGDKIRIPRGKATAFGDGPYARYMVGPGTISASSEPTLKPASVNVLLVYTAVANWADRGGMKDPRPFLNMAQRAWVGDASTHWGILGMLKGQNALQGMESFNQASGSILGTVDTGAGYNAI